MRKILKNNWNVKLGDTEYKNVSIPFVAEIKKETYPNPFHSMIVYERKLKELSGKKGKRVLLRFHGIDYKSVLFVNQTKVFTHENGFDSFDLEVTDLVSFDGEDLLKIEVFDFDITVDNSKIIGKQDWYGNAIGIFQDVELWVVPDIFIKSVRVYPADTDGNIKVSIESSDKRYQKFNIEIHDDTDEIVYKSVEERNEFTIRISNPKLWSPQTPSLYKIVITNEFGDYFETFFGIRTISVEGNKILLNGEPLYIVGALDQNFYPKTHYSLPDKISLLSELTKAKEMTLNLLRFHVKIPDNLYLDLCDEIGILVWIDLPYARKLDDTSKNNLENLLKNVLERHSNHPSFVILSLINESWGLDLTKTDEQNWLGKLFCKAKNIDSTRLYVDNSACMGNKHVVSDIDDYHFYSSFPYHNKGWENTINSFAKNTFKTFYYVNSSTRPKVVSEFGLWGVSDPKCWEGNWHEFPVTVFGKTFEGSEPMHFPKKISHFHDTDDFIYQAQLSQFLGLKYQIEIIKLNPEISGYVITEFSDIGWESNGLLDFKRFPKFFYKYLNQLNNSVVGIIKSHKALLFEDENYKGQLFVVNNSCKDLDLEVRIFTETKVVSRKIIFVNKMSISEAIFVEFIPTESDHNIFIELFCREELISRNFYPLQILKYVNNNFEKIFVGDGYEDETYICIGEEHKLGNDFDLKGDWINSVTVFNVRRDLNLSALLWDLGELSTKNMLSEKQSKILSSSNSIITRVYGWGYFFGSLLTIAKNNDKLKVITTLQNCEKSSILIDNILQSLEGDSN